MQKPSTIATLTGSDGWATAYVSIKEVVDFEGPLVSTPIVTTPQSGYMAISNVAVNWYGNINGVRYEVGEIITFEVSAILEADRMNEVEVEFETAERLQTSVFLIKQRQAAAGTLA